MRNLILDTTSWAVQRSRFVKINETAIRRLFGKHLDALHAKHPEEDELSPGITGKELAEWVFVVEILNHCFWPDPGEPKWEVEYKGKWYSGYWALEASLARAVNEYKIPAQDARFLANIQLQDLEKIFAGRGKIPLLKERLKNLREAGEVLLERWEGSVVYLLEEAGHSALKLIELLRDNFPSFRDEAIYNGKKVYFYKRAQIFPLDLHTKFRGKSWGRWKDLHMLTAFADYKLPQVLRHLGILEYDSQLARRIDNLEFIEPGSEKEIEIRAATIQACELIKKKLEEEKGIECASPEIDQWLWTLGQNDSFRKYPYHRTRTIFY